jgi:ADP-heptose:LPS heptosyltransferase
MINATGLLRAIKMRYPKIELHVLASPYNSIVLRDNPHVDHIGYFRTGKGLTYLRSLTELRRRRYDVVIDPLVNRAKRANFLLAVASGAPYRVGFRHHGWGGAFTLPVSDPDPVETYVRRSAAVLEPFGIRARDVDLRPEIFLTADEKARAASAWKPPAGVRLLVNISAAASSRRWFDERFVGAVADSSARCGGWNVVVIGVPSERSSSESIASQLTSRGISAVAAHTPEVHDAFALVQSAEIVLTADTSIAHAASAFNVPAVVMMTRDKITYRPHDTPVRTVVTDAKDYQSISVAEVASALCELFGDIRGKLASPESR